MAFNFFYQLERKWLLLVLLERENKPPSISIFLQFWDTATNYRIEQTLCSYRKVIVKTFYRRILWGIIWNSCVFQQTVLQAHTTGQRMPRALNAHLVHTNLHKVKRNVFPAVKASLQPLMERWKSQIVLVGDHIFINIVILFDLELGFYMGSK